MYSSSEEEELPHVNVESRGCPLNYNISGSPEIVILDEELPSVEKSHGFDSAVTTVADQDVNGRSDSDNVPDKAQEGTRVKRNYKEAAVSVLVKHFLPKIIPTYSSSHWHSLSSSKLNFNVFILYY